MNKIIKNTLILAAITVVSGLVLGAAYEVTKGPIAQTQAKQKQEACQAVYPEADSFEAMDVDQKAAKEAIKKMGTNATVDEVYSAVMDGSEAGYVITVTDKDGYGGDIQITVGIMSDGTVNGISFLSISETAGLGMRAKEPSFYNQFAGQQAEKFYVSKDGGDIDAITASTITSRAFLNAVNAAYQAFKGNTSDAASGASVQAGRVENATGTGSDSIH